MHILGNEITGKSRIRSIFIFGRVLFYGKMMNNVQIGDYNVLLASDEFKDCLIFEWGKIHYIPVIIFLYLCSICIL